jgi:tRNA (guanine-N7-)-methyltransferase
LLLLSRPQLPDLMATRPPFHQANAANSDPVGGGFFGRGKLKRLSDRKQSLVDDVLPRLRIDPAATTPEERADLRLLFPHRPERITLEIGFGGGEHLAHRAAEAPDEGFIGIEPFINGMAKGLAAIAERGLGNVRLYDRDAAEVIAILPAQSLEMIYLLYPDPWPKRRHNKRRFLNQGSLKAFHRLLKPGGLFRFASDIDDYVGWTLAHVERSGFFDWQAEKATDWTQAYPGWPGTRYEAKAFREGRVPSYLQFIRKA